MRDSQLEQVAKCLGVSKSTVSKAVNHCAGIGSELILYTAREQGLSGKPTGDCEAYVILPEISAYFWSKVYRELSNGDNTQQLQADIASTMNRYNPYLEQNGQELLDEAGAEREIVAGICAEMLEGDADFINRLCAEKPTVAQRIWQTIKDFIRKLRGVNDPEMDNIRRVEKLFEKALGEAVGQSNDGGTQFSIKRDAEGRRYVEVDNDILADVPRSEWISTVSENLKTIFGRN